MRRTNDFIKVTNMKVFAYHGVLEEEMISNVRLPKYQRLFKPANVYETFCLIAAGCTTTNEYDQFCSKTVGSSTFMSYFDTWNRTRTPITF